VSISGTAFNDVNGNGTRDAGEPALANWIIYRDLNNDGVFNPGEPSTVTNAQGAYSFTGVGPGTQYIPELLLPGRVQTTPGSATAGAHVITPTSGQSVTGRDFGNRLINPATISGQKFHDLNANGVKDAGEPGLAGWRVYIDANGNGILDATEQFADT